MLVEKTLENIKKKVTPTKVSWKILANIIQKITLADVR